MNVIDRTPETGDIYTWYNDCLKAYTSCQVIKVYGKNQAHLLYLDWIGEKPLDIDTLPRIKPLYIDAFFHKEGYCIYCADSIVPKGFLFVANIEPLVKEDGCRWGYWDEFSWELPYQRKWEKIPLEKRIAFKAAKDDSSVIKFNGLEMPRNIIRIDDTEINFHNLCELNVFPCVVDLRLSKNHPGLREYLRINPFVSNLTLEEPGAEEIDLRDSFLKKLIINLRPVRSLYIDDDLETLQTLNTEAEECYIASENKGASVLLCQQRAFSMHPELGDLEQLSVCNIKSLDVGSISTCYPNLELLELNGVRGDLYNFEKIGALRNLKKLYVHDFATIQMDYFPKPDEMSNLKTFQMTAIPKEIGKEVRKLYSKKMKSDNDFILSVSNLK